MARNEADGKGSAERTGSEAGGTRRTRHGGGAGLVHDGLDHSHPRGGQELAAEIGPGARRARIGEVEKPVINRTIRQTDKAPKRARP